MDDTKTFLVLDNHRRVLICFGKALGFVFYHLGSVSVLYFLLFLNAIFLIAAYLFGSHFFDGRSWFLIVILFAFQQIFIFLRVGLRLQFFASQIVLVK